jgi:RNA polymerase sigma factor for flagellar operon FliA
LRTLNWLPRSSVSRLRQIETTLTNLHQRLGRPATDEEAATEIGVTTERYRQMLFEVSTTMLSLDAPLSAIIQEDDSGSIGAILEDKEALTPEDEVEQMELASALTTAIEALPQREQLLLSLYYKEELTMKEISKIMGVSESRICQLHIQAILRLRGALHAFKTDEEKLEENKLEKLTRQTKNTKKDIVGKKGEAATLSSVQGKKQRVS